MLEVKPRLEALAVQLAGVRLIVEPEEALRDGVVDLHRASLVGHEHRTNLTGGHARGPRSNTADGMKRKYLSGKKREDVRDKLTKAMANRDKGLIYDDKNMTVGEYLDPRLSDSVRDTVKESTYSRDKYLATNHVKPTLGGLKLKNMNALHLQGLYRDRLDSGLSGSTVQKIHHVLHKALAQAVR